MKQSRLSILLGMLSILLSACGAPHRATRIASHTAFQIPQAGLTDEQKGLIAQHCPAGAPVVGSTAGAGPTRMVFHEGYVLQHSSKDKIPSWVCEEVSKNQLLGNQPRVDDFRPEPALPAGQRAELADYKGSGYDRGHQAPAGNQTRNAILKRDTFYLSNMSPQTAKLNRFVWASLEELVRSWIESGQLTDAKVITGGMFYDPAEDDPQTADGVVNYFTIGVDVVAVPTHFYKIVVGRKAGDSQASAIAFVLENRNYRQPYDFGSFIKSIAWIEERTGINFMPDLDSAESNRLESHAPALWFH
jgi:endonuclease G